MRLEARVTLWILGMIGAGASVTLLATAHFQRDNLERQFGEAGLVLAQTVRNSLEVSMINNSPDDVRTSVQNVRRGTLIQSVSVYRRDGSLWVSSIREDDLAATKRAALQSTLGTGRPHRLSRGGSLSVYVPVTKRSECAACHPGTAKVLGAVGVSLDEIPWQAALERDTRKSIYAAALPLGLGLFASMWALRRTLLRPLAMVGMAAERVAAGDLAVRLPEFETGELAAVAGTFNEMTARLEHQAADLRGTVDQLRSDLEGLEEIHALMASGAGLPKLLGRASGHLGQALAAAGAGIWRVQSRRPVASWGNHLPPATAVRLAQDGQVHSSEGPLDSVPVDAGLAWIVAPAIRGDRTLAVVGVAWSPPRALGASERDLLRSLAGVVALAVENAELLERVHEKERSLEGLLKKTLAAQEDERRRVARELHDETSQVLAAVMMNIEVLDSELRSRKPVRQRISAVKALAEEAVRNLDKVMLDLRPALLDELGLIAALRWYLTQMQEAWGIAITIDARLTDRLPEHVEMAAFRIVQEAVANAVRHANAHTIRVQISDGEGSVRIEVEDDGAGFDLNKALARSRSGESAGLLGMTERAELIGGHLRVHSRPGRGTRITAGIPLVGG